LRRFDSEQPAFDAAMCQFDAACVGIDSGRVAFNAKCASVNAEHPEFQWHTFGFHAGRLGRHAEVFRRMSEFVRN
jgi:hypothetical protein